MFRFRRRVVRWKLSLADIAAQMKRKPGKRVVISPLAFEAVQRIDRIFAIERDINGCPAAERLAVRQSVSAPLVTALGNWMREQRGLLSANDAVGKKMDYMLNAGPAFTAFLDDGQICLTNNAAERALRAIASGRKAWLFVGSDRGGERAAMIYALIATCRLNDVDPLVWLTDVLTRIADISQTRLHELLPGTWQQMREQIDTAQTA
jgi:transposase